MAPGSLDLRSLADAYRQRTLRPRDVVREIHRRCLARGDDHAWISRASLDEMLARAETLESFARDLPLYGIPFAVKDNIDVAGVPTTAGCPAFAYTPAVSATVVERLLAAGAIYVGKTNLDQFATGLVGTRSPYGSCPNAFDPRYVSGGSSAGSGVAVAAGLASFALGTDTAGSGRVPAAFNNIVGLKPTRGLVSAAGVVPACRSLDCVSIFALTSDDAQAILNVAAGFDARDPYSRQDESSARWSGATAFRFGVPRAKQLEFYGDDEARALYQQALKRLEAIGGTRAELDFEPFLEAARLLYDGPWVAERVAGVGDFVREHPEAVHPVVREILSKALQYSAADLFRAQDRLRQLSRVTENTWRDVDILALPTAPTIHTIESALAEPIKRNAELGYYTNFVNLLDLSALAVPAGMRPDRLPFGITLIAPRFEETALTTLGARYHRHLGGSLGATTHPLPEERAQTQTIAAANTVRVAVVGAHLSGQPLNHQLTERGGRLVKTCRTASHYRLFALHGTVPPKPGLMFQPGSGGTGIEVEIWEMPMQHFGSFVAAIPAPLGIGTLILDDGDQVKGFLCEPYALADALDITHHGGWRGYLHSLRAA